MGMHPPELCPNALKSEDMHDMNRPGLLLGATQIERKPELWHGMTKPQQNTQMDPGMVRL